MATIDRQFNHTKLEIGEKQNGFLADKKVLLSCNSSTNQHRLLQKETLEALEELGGILKNIRKRMISEGYEIIDGTLHKVGSINLYGKS
ncbi:MAG TPA: hypothetical protein P5056_03525 [Candidatus Paceibacterota bacterium]|nr:hypothetical protein [Candidatus Paceibacterota bacterium]